MNKYRINYWIHGHTHSPVNLKMYNTHVLCNPRGYCANNENPNFHYRFIIELKTV